MTGKVVRIVLASAIVLSVAGATPAMAKGGVERTGMCSGSADWKLKAAPENGKLQVEYEVDSNKVGQTWRVRIFHDGVRIFAGHRITKAPSGSFTVRLLSANHAGTDAFRARAVNVANSQVCGGAVSI
jgi:hypothetical protein